MRLRQLLLGIVSAAASAFVSIVAINAMLTWNETPWNGMQELRIRTQGSSALGFREKLTLIAEGQYGTQTVPVRASWDVPQGITVARFSDCIESSTCEVTALEEPGLITVRATFDGKTALSSITVKSVKPSVSAHVTRTARFFARIRSLRFSIVSK